MSQPIPHDTPLAVNPAVIFLVSVISNSLRPSEDWGDMGSTMTSLVQLAFGVMDIDAWLRLHLHLTRDLPWTMRQCDNGWGRRAQRCRGKSLPFRGCLLRILFSCGEPLPSLIKSGFAIEGPPNHHLVSKQSMSHFQAICWVRSFETPRFVDYYLATMEFEEDFPCEERRMEGGWKLSADWFLLPVYPCGSWNCANKGPVQTMEE